MRSLLFLTVFLCSFASFAQEKTADFIKARPEPARAVNDFGWFLKQSEKVQLEKQLTAFRRKKDYSIVIIGIPALTDNKGNEYTIEETAQLYFDKWGIGDAVKNDGVLILLSKQPRRIRIHTGMGMETLLTNADCRSIINYTMVPSFKAGQYFDGLKNTIEEIETRITYNESANKTEAASGSRSTNDVSSSNSAGEAQQAYAPQPVYPTQAVEQHREGLTFAQFLYGFIFLATFLWFYFRYKLKKASLGNSGVYSRSGYSRGGNVVTNNNSNWGGKKRGWFNSGSSSGSSWFSGSGGYSSGSGSFSSGSASGSYGGGKSNGGGASGSW